MNSFTYQYPVKVHFGDRIAKDSLTTELKNYSKSLKNVNDLI